MSSPCTAPRFVRCRVRDLASCFHACRLPLEEEPDILSSKSPEMSRGSIVFDPKSCSKGHKASRKMSVAKKMCKKVGEESVQSSSLYNNRKGGQAEPPRLPEEDYIVFCFREDGAIQMINEGKSYDGNDERDSITNASAAALRPIDMKGGSKKMDTEWPPDDEIKEINSIEQQSPGNLHMDVSFESRDSTPSDTSTSSFAFPILGIEWIGSPVHMPKSEKREDGSVRLHCCSL